MAHWDSAAGVDVPWPSRWDERSPGWLWIDCGCCKGIAWGGEEPIDCCLCKGGGWLAVHVDSGTVALYPGGPLAGRRFDAEEVRLYLDRVEVP
jgi:hypothetical protein